MKVKNVEVPRLGLRNIKTSLAVFLSFLVFRIIGRDYPIYACIAAIICTKDTFKNSFEVSKDRIIGTIIGGLVGGVFLQINSNFQMNFSFEIISSLGIMLVIYLCNLINEKGTVSLACVVFLLIMINFKDVDSTAPYAHAFDRTLDTAIGIAISLVVNRYVFPYNEAKKEGDGD